jgi:integrase
VHWPSIRLTVSPKFLKRFVLKLEQEKRETMKQTPYYVVESSTNFPFPKQESGKTSPSTSKVVSASVHSVSCDQAHNILGLDEQKAKTKIGAINGHSPGHINCALCAESKEVTMSGSSHFAALPFPVAAELWMEEQSLYWKPATKRSYRGYLRRLKLFFGEMKLNEIHIGNIREYQKAHIEKITNAAINHDTNTLSQMLRKAGLWEPIAEFYRPLTLPRWSPPRVLTEQEEDAFFKIAARDGEWSCAYWWASITNNTTASGVELRTLQLKHIDLAHDPPMLYVPDETAKNQFRARPVPLNEIALKQIKRSLARAYKLGAKDQEHYLFPFRINRAEYDVTRPASESFIYKQWNKLVEAALSAGAIKHRIRPHDLRHQIITTLLENGEPEQTVMALAGHVRREMLEHYSHTRIKAKHSAVTTLAAKRMKRLA